MASVGELKDAIKDTLDRKGLLKQLQGNLRAQVYKVLLDAEEEPRPEPSNENLIINELIREYMIFNGYRDTLSVFIPESGQPQTRPFDRQFLHPNVENISAILFFFYTVMIQTTQQLHIAETTNSEQVPLLYTLVAQRQRLSTQQQTATNGYQQAGEAEQQQLGPSSVQQQTGP